MMAHRSTSVRIVVLAMLFALYAPVRAQGIIVVSNDDWMLSNAGFNTSPYARLFALNLANFFAPQGGRFLCFSNNFCLTESILDTTLRNAGYRWEISTTVPFVPDNLLLYDAVWLADSPSLPDTSVLVEYVRRGGKVYVCGGTRTDGGWTSRAWNGFLRHFGLSFSSTINGLYGTIPCNGSHPILAGVHELYHFDGNSIIVEPGNSHVRGLTPDDSMFLFAVYDGRATSVGGDPPDLPTGNALLQNYPNPFNPSTRIGYTLRAHAHVVLTVTNTLGEQVAKLEKGEQDAGYHEWEFDARGLPGGVYFYRLEVLAVDFPPGGDFRGGRGSFVETRKALLLR